jgi:glyoxylase-like metal-dependent hydrolase (beta-lactamase superfamily II)
VPPNSPIRADRIRRLHYGYIVAPAGTPDEGQPIPVCGYVVPYPRGTLLFDTGISPFDDETRERYHPRVRSPEEALHSVGLKPGDINLIANCHLHADHAGGNHRFPNVPVLVQRAELDAARKPDYTFPAYAWDYPGARLEIVEGEVQVAPGLRLVPTAGHSPGHQSLLVDTDRGPLLLAGQAVNTASQFSSAAFAERLDADGLDRIGTYPDWMPRVRNLHVHRALFAHDLLVYERDEAELGRPQLA